MYRNGEWYGTNYRNGSFKSNSIRYIFYAKDFTDKQLQDILGKYKLTVTWIDSEGRSKEQMIPVGQYFQDKRGE